MVGKSNGDPDERVTDPAEDGETTTTTTAEMVMK